MSWFYSFFFFGRRFVRFDGTVAVFCLSDVVGVSWSFVRFCFGVLIL